MGSSPCVHSDGKFVGSDAGEFWIAPEGFLKLCFNSPAAILESKIFILVIVKDLDERGQKTPDEEWIKTLADDRKVKFSCQDILEEGASIATKIERNDVTFPIILTKGRNPLSHRYVKRFGQL
jgi:hypothetical protein